MGTLRKRAKLQLSHEKRKREDGRARKTLGRNELLQDTERFNRCLAATRRMMLSLPPVPLPVLRRANYALDSEDWMLHYVSPTRNSADDQRGRRPLRLKEFPYYEGTDRAFLCPSCARFLPIGKRFARKMCQACYKRYLKTHQGEVPQDY